MHYTLVAQPGRYPTRRQLSTPALVHRTRQQRLTPTLVCTLWLGRIQLLPLVLHLQAWVERIAQAVTEEIKGQHSKENGHPWEETDPRVDFQNHQTGFQVPAPARRGGLCPESQEAQGGFGDDRRPHAQRRGDDDGRHAVWQNVPPQ